MFKLFEFCTKTHITFKFEDFLYKQMNSIAMGSLLASACADIFFTKCEYNIIHNLLNSLNILFYYRFVDDILFIISEDKNKNDLIKLILFIKISNLL